METDTSIRTTSIRKRRSPTPSRTDLSPLPSKNSAFFFSTRPSLNCTRKKLTKQHICLKKNQIFTAIQTECQETLVQTTLPHPLLWPKKLSASLRKQQATEDISTSSSITTANSRRSIQSGAQQKYLKSSSSYGKDNSKKKKPKEARQRRSLNSR